MKTKSFPFIAAIAVLAGLFTACQKENSTMPSQSPQYSNVRGTIVINPASNPAAGRVVAFDNGTLAKPVSGFPQFNTANPGARFQLNYNVVSTQDNILSIAVLRVDSLPPAPDTLSFSGNYSGQFSFSATDTSGGLSGSGGGLTTVTFNGLNYTSTASATGYPLGGSGTYRINPGNTVTFTNTAAFPASADTRLILNGTYSYTQSGTALHLSRTTSVAGVTTNTEYHLFR
ncbi:MAG: hypothetical protein JNM88_05375 [Chitinophagaceae bacterium]|nr:hypothetical protein [Chitinophagaceae bacterium]